MDVYTLLRSSRVSAGNGEAQECACQLAALARLLAQLQHGKVQGAAHHPWRTTDVCQQLRSLIDAALRAVEGRRKSLVVALANLDEVSVSRGKATPNL